MKVKVVAIDVFCGVGGLTHGLIQSGIPILAGIDNDESCRYAYEKNNNAKFIQADVKDISGSELKKMYPRGCIKVLVGCAPCQPFSTHTQKIKNRLNDEKWGLLYSFRKIIQEANPDIVSMENVVQLAKYEVFSDFITGLSELGYKYSWSSVYCPNYGIPQNRRRLVLLASKFGEIALIPKTHLPTNYRTVQMQIGDMEPINAGEVSKKDKLHRSAFLSPINMKRIKQSKPGGTWKDWDDTLRSPCHKKETGQTYSAVYARMQWDAPSPTITTQFFRFGTGRFGHPYLNRALSLREGALLQTFPKHYDFLEPNSQFSYRKLGVHIGNAVPVELGHVIGKSILEHLERYHVV